MPTTKKITAVSGTGESWVCTVVQDATGKVLDNADGLFRSPAVVQSIPMTEHLITNDAPEDIAGFYELSESRSVWDNGTYTVLKNKAAWTTAPQIEKILIVNDQQVLLWQPVS